MDIGLLIIRLAVGLTMSVHGAQKLFGWFGGYGVSGTGAFLEQLGFRPGRVHAVAAGSTELLGGLLLATGTFAPAGAAAIVAVMLVAVATVHWSHGFFGSNGGFEYNLLLTAAAVGIAFAGPGAWSIDHLAGTTWAGGTAGLAALIAGLAGGAAQLAGRRQPHSENATEPESLRASA